MTVIDATPELLRDILPASTQVLASSRDEAAWLVARGAMWTASEIATLVGLGGWSYSKQVAAKAAGTHDASVGRLVQVRAGKFLERGILDWYEDDSLFPVIHNTHLLRAAGTCVGATPDALTQADDGGYIPVEVKNVQYESAHNWHYHTSNDISDMYTAGFNPSLLVPVSVGVATPFLNQRVATKDVGTVRGAVREHAISFRRDLLPLMGVHILPAKYWVQLQVQMYVTGAARGRAVCCMAGTTRIVMDFERCDVFIEKMLATCASAWQDVETRRRYAPTEGK